MCTSPVDTAPRTAVGVSSGDGRPTRLFLPPGATLIADGDGNPICSIDLSPGHDGRTMVHVTPINGTAPEGHSCWGSMTIKAAGALLSSSNAAFLEPTPMARLLGIRPDTFSRGVCAVMKDLSAYCPDSYEQLVDCFLAANFQWEIRPSPSSGQWSALSSVDTETGEVLLYSFGETTIPYGEAGKLSLPLSETEWLSLIPEPGLTRTIGLARVDVLETHPLGSSKRINVRLVGSPADAPAVQVDRCQLWRWPASS